MEIKSRFISVVKKIIFSAGIFFLVLCLVACTRLPFDLHQWLGTANADFDFTPECIIIPGGSGMPSEANLIRLYYASEIAVSVPTAKVILLHPIDTSVATSMMRFLVTHGVDSMQIHWYSEGTNTREQVLLLKENQPGMEHMKIVVVTSPEHMYRTLGVFRKLGFKNVGGVSAFEQAMFVDLGYDHSKTGGKWYMPDVSANTGLRYNFWNYLKLQITCYRELLAIMYYKLNGWT